MDYWQKRQEAMYKAGEMQVNQYFKRLEKAFNQTKRELQKTIEAFYFRYAEENGLSFAAAQKRLNAEELGELDDFIALAMDNIGKYNQQVNNMSLKARVTRYQALEMQVDAILRQLYAIDYQAESEKAMQEVYEDTYYRTWYSIDQYHGFHQAFAQVEPRTVEKLLEYPFNGAAFSSRIWKQKDHLQTQLTEAVTTMLIQGRHPSTLTREFAKKMQSKKFDAYRLLHTESSFLMSEATHAGYKEDGVEKYEILAILDSKTCEICGELDGNVYEVGKEVTGVNMPPFHPLCRCTDVPHYEDTPAEGMVRVARDPETGKTYEVPADMTYSEWKKVVDEGGDFTSWKKPGKQGDSENQKRYAARREEWKRRRAAEIEPKTIQEAKAQAENLGVKYVFYDNVSLDMANEINRALETIPEDIRPVFVGDSASLESYQGAKLPRTSNHFYGVHIDVPPTGLIIGRNETTGQVKYDFEVQGQMIGISKKFNSADKITKSKIAEQKKYVQKHGNRWFFNEDGKSTPYHEMGHVYEAVKGLPDGFERDAERWWHECKCDMLKNPKEAWSEAWGAYHTRNEELPDYIAKYIEGATAKPVAKDAGSDIIKGIKIPSSALSAKNITEDIVDEIQSGIDEILREYDAKIDFISVRDMSTQFPDTPYMIQFSDDSGIKKVDFIINSGFDFDGFRDVVSAGYESGYFAGKSIKDHAIHEMAHAMTGQQYKTVSAFRDFAKRLEKKYVPGVSGYADATKDGFEVIAEAFVRMRNNEPVPKEAKELVVKYVERWRKQ